MSDSEDLPFDVEYVRLLGESIGLSPAECDDLHARMRRGEAAALEEIDGSPRDKGAITSLLWNLRKDFEAHGLNRYLIETVGNKVRFRVRRLSNPTLS